MADETFTPTDAIATAAKRALRWLEEGHAGSGFTDVGRRRASQLAGKQPVSLETVKRMHSFFSRHAVDKKGKDFDNLSKPSPGRVAWDAWGGDAGASWAKRIVESRSDKANMADQASLFARIIKADKQADGTLLVTGIATDDSVDVDDQICDPEWLKAAMPDWFRWGNIREQHSNIAAGVATEYEAKGSQHWITARVVDPASVKKVESGVLKGFSIGIRGPRVVKDDKAAGGRIVDGQIVEVSLVDRPANPVCTLSLAKSVDGELQAVEELVEKREVGTEERERLAEEGRAMPDGSYPIATRADLRNAIAAYGRAKDPAAVKRHIIRRARQLDAIEMLPEAWGVDKETDMTEETEVTKEETPGEETTETTVEETSGEATEESSVPSTEETKMGDAMCEDCGKAESECKCDEGGFERKADDEVTKEESSQAVGEESSQKPGEESSRPGGIAGVAGKSVDERLTSIEEMLTVLVQKFAEVDATEGIAKSVDEITERLSVVEKSARVSAPVRMAIGEPKPAVNENVTKAAEYRAKAMAATDPIIAKGYLSLASELDQLNK